MKKVIEQELFPNIEILLDDFGHIEISQLCINSLLKNPTVKEDLILVENNSRTEVAKAICPKYQETEDENKILKNQIESIFKNANDKVESLEQKNAKLLEALKMHVDSLDLSNMEFYEKYGFNVADVFPRTRQLIQQSETK